MTTSECAVTSECVHCAHYTSQTPARGEVCVCVCAIKLYLPSCMQPEWVVAAAPLFLHDPIQQSSAKPCGVLLQEWGALSPTPRHPERKDKSGSKQRKETDDREQKEPGRGTRENEEIPKHRHNLQAGLSVCSLLLSPKKMSRLNTAYNSHYRISCMQL